MMTIKLTFLLILLAFADGGGLLRKPKVYNAVITTDDNLQPSRSYPFIQPVIHETPISFHHYIGGYDYSQFAVPEIIHAPNNNQLQDRSESPQVQQTISKTDEKTDGEGKNSKAEEPIKDESKDSKDPMEITERSPIALTEFGLPPSLIPLSSFSSQYPYSLQQYPYTSYPLIYDSFGSYHHGFHPNSPLLPPYAYYPSYKPEINIQPSLDNFNQQKSDRSEQDQPQQSDIRNYVSKNKDIPDDHIPPLPIKSSKSDSS